MKNSNYIIDFHSHMRPGIDDGSADIFESEKMLRASAMQGIDEVFLTSHFYAESMELKQFISEREYAFNKLIRYLSGIEYNFPKLRLGAEVAYYMGISHSESIKKLAIDGTNLILIEMPFFNWSKNMMSEVLDMIDSLKLIPVLAHIERYLDYVSSWDLKKMVKAGVLIQTNASFILSQPKRVNKMIKKGMVHFFGSDAHNTGSRQQQLGYAIDKLFEMNEKQAVSLLKEQVEYLS